MVVHDLHLKSECRTKRTNPERGLVLFFFFNQQHQTMIPFPSINQFRSVVKHVRQKASYVGLDAAGEPIYNHAAKFPTLTFVGTTKLHGTNAAIVFTKENTVFQSRERELTLEQDNAGFMNHMVQHPIGLIDLACAIEEAAKVTRQPDEIVVYGEWCGGNIQKNIAIAGLPKMFVIFAIKIDGEWFTDPVPGLRNEAASIYDIEGFGSHYISINFETPEIAQNQLSQLTETVEACCPVGKTFGIEGIGEGLVWRCTSDPTSDLWFKVKGEKHSASKVKTLALVDIELVEGMRAFVEKTVTEARLEQGLQNLQREQLKPFDMTSMGDFLRWIHGDIMKEEGDTLEASGLDAKKLGGPIATAAKRWYIEKLNADVFA